MDIQIEFNEKMETEVIGLFREDGTAFICVACGNLVDIIVEEGGVSSCGAAEPACHWAYGRLVCTFCGATESWCDSS